VVYVLCQEQAQKQEVSDEEFGRSMFGDAITEAADAFVEELVNFFPDRRIRESLRAMLRMGKKVGEEMLQRLEKEVETRLGKIDPAAEGNRLASELINSSGSVPGSSASIPDLSLYGSSSE
jgi:hypothetical protein